MMLQNKVSALKTNSVSRASCPIRASTKSKVLCKATSDADTTRRSVLISGGVAAASPLILTRPSLAETGLLEVDQLSTFQRSDQKNEYRLRVEAVLKEVLVAADAPACVRLALHDAGTFDFATKTGGFDGSIAKNSEELSRPENAGLKAMVEKLAKAKQTIDEGDREGGRSVGWADLIYLSGKVATQKKWFEAKVGSPTMGSSGGLQIATKFPNPWPVEIGRIDRDEPGPNAVPPMNADVEEVRQWLLKLGADPNGGGFLAPRPPFWEKPGFLMWTAAADNPEAEEERLAAANPEAFGNIKLGYDRSRKTYTRTDYEVDFAQVYNKLCSLGARINGNAYLYPIPVAKII